MATASFSFSQISPVANDDALQVYTNSGANTVDVQANDTDDGPVLITTIITPPLHGSAIVLGNDSIVYTPDSNYCGPDSMVYRVCDFGLPVLCDNATLRISVDPVDSDGDGLNDVYESYTGDFDGDGVYNFLDIDSDNDGISDAAEANETLSCNPAPVDTDGDLIPDYLDLDSDNDGISDLVENGFAAYDTDNDGIIDNLSAVDHNGNGMPDALETSADLDTDGDLVPDRIDLDSDNDGVADVVESYNGTNDTNGDGFVSALDTNGGDSDNDGIPDSIDNFVGAGDGIGYQSTDSLDTDKDGVLNYRDLDSDNDGLTDLVECGFISLDIDLNGVIDGTDSDNDGIINVTGLDGNNTFGATTGSQSSVLLNNDGDGSPNNLDLDSDNDGLSDVIENGFGSLDTNNDGVIDGADTDFDGIINGSFLDSNSVFGAQPGSQSITLLDPDNDGLINSIDLDDDNDGIGDLVEFGFGAMDVDNNGVIDGIDTDKDGIMDHANLDNSGTFGGKPGVQDENSNDFDGDGIRDYFDLDSDNDTIPDVYEGGFGVLDTDNDGRIDGTDTDLDGVINVSPVDTNSVFGFSSGSQNEFTMDADSDGSINSEDLDSDADGLSDKEEWDWDQDGIGNDDCDNNNIPNYLDPLSCILDVPNAFSPNGDGVNDVFSIKGINVFPGNKFSVFNRWGVVVFEMQDYDNSWDGTSDALGALGGGFLPVGTYFYVLDLGNGSSPVSGYIYLNR